MSHAVMRTSQFGGPFIGRCTKCGQDGLTMGAALVACPADDLVSDEQALLDILDQPEPHAYSPDYMAMGDCQVCGHTEAAHRATLTDNSPTKGTDTEKANDR